MTPAKSSPRTTLPAPMIVVGIVSSYLDGRLLAGALDSLETVGLDKLYIYEGPAGDPLEHAALVPPSDFGGRDQDGAYLAQPTVIRHGRWRTDARKRQAILEHVKRDYPNMPIWGVVIDGDEILLNGQYVRDILQHLLWDDEPHAGNPEHRPWARWPIRKIERDGAMAIAGGRIVRLDFITEYLVSNATLTNVWGLRDGWGDVVETNTEWLERFLGALDSGRQAAWPPFPCEPHFYHRPHLRHPLRRGLRLHEQEANELDRLKLKDGT